MIFRIQASNPKYQYMDEFIEQTLSEAIENIFPMSTENAIIMWNYICIPLSYKYDISYMIDDILKLLYSIQNNTVGRMVIHWLPDTFRCDWTIEWKNDKIDIHSQWECTVGNLESILNNNNRVSLMANDFVCEWREVLGIVIKGLVFCGCDKNKTKGMSELIEMYESISNSGMMYRE